MQRLVFRWMWTSASVTSCQSQISECGQTQKEQCCRFCGLQAIYALIERASLKTLQPDECSHRIQRPYRSGSLSHQPHWKLRMLKKTTKSYLRRNDKKLYQKLDQLRSCDNLLPLLFGQAKTAPWSVKGTYRWWATRCIPGCRPCLAARPTAYPEDLPSSHFANPKLFRLLICKVRVGLGQT